MGVEGVGLRFGFGGAAGAETDGGSMVDVNSFETPAGLGCVVVGLRAVSSPCSSRRVDKVNRLCT